MPIHRPAGPQLRRRAVGAGAAGAATAHLLARLRIARAPPRPRPLRHRHPLHARPDARRRAAAVPVGLLEKVIAAGTPPVRRATFRYADAVVPVTIKPAHGVDALYAPRRTVLDPILVDAAVAAGARRAVRHRRGRRRPRPPRCRHRRRRPDPDGQAFRARARIVIGADGIRSTIAERAGAAAV